MIVEKALVIGEVNESQNIKFIGSPNGVEISQGAIKISEESGLEKKIRQLKENHETIATKIHT